MVEREDAYDPLLAVEATEAQLEDVSFPGAGLVPLTPFSSGRSRGQREGDDSNCDRFHVSFLKVGWLEEGLDVAPRVLPG